MGVFSIFRKKEESAYYVAAKELIKACNIALDTGLKFDFNSMPPEQWHPIFPNDRKSPRVTNVGDNSKLIFYPKNSTPYTDIMTVKPKEVFVLEGNLYDENHPENIFQAKDKYRIFPNQNVRPYTKDEEALVFVKIVEQ